MRTTYGHDRYVSSLSKREFDAIHLAAAGKITA